MDMQCYRCECGYETEFATNWQNHSACCSIRAKFANMERELAEARKDVERYRWLRDLKCNSVTVGHDDENACNYDTAKDWIENHMYKDEFDGVPADELQRMKDSNSIWAIQIYPHTPVGFNKYYGATLDAAIDAALSQSGNDKPNISESIRAEG